MKILLATIFTFLTLGTTALLGQTAKAAFDPFKDACLSSNDQSSVCIESKKNQPADGNNSLYGKNGILSRVITVLDIVIGVVAVVMVVIGGFKFVLSGGDSNNVNSARNTVLYALVGIVIAVSGQVIVKFVLNRL